MSPPPPGRTAAPEREAGAGPATTFPAACSRRNREEQANPRQSTRTPHGPWPGTASEHEPERYGGHTLHAQSDANYTNFVACPGEAEGRTEARRPPAPLAPPAAQSGGMAHRPPPPQPTPTPPPGAATPQGRGPTPWGALSPKPGRGETGPGRPPEKQTKRSTGPRQDARRGTDCMQRPYQRPAPGPREVRAPQQPGEGRGGERTPRERERTHTQRTRGEYQKGNRTEPAECTVPASEGKGQPDGTARHTQRGTRGLGRGTRGRQDTRYRPEPPELAAGAAHTRPGHCTCQGSSGAPRHAPAPRLGSLRASPRGSHWRQASSTGPAVPAPRATTHQGGHAVGKRLQLQLLSDALTREEVCHEGPPTRSRQNETSSLKT